MAGTNEIIPPEWKATPAPVAEAEIEKIVHAVLAAHHATQLKPWKDWRFLLGIPAFLIAVGTLWLSLGFPTVASSNDVHRLDRNAAEDRIQIYQNSVNNLIANTPTKDAPETQQRAWQQQLDQTNKSLDRAIQNKIELSR